MADQSWRKYPEVNGKDSREMMENSTVLIYYSKTPQLRTWIQFKNLSG